LFLLSCELHMLYGLNLLDLPIILKHLPCLV
jgi:hypothetical protein